MRYPDIRIKDRKNPYLGFAYRAYNYDRFPHPEVEDSFYAVEEIEDEENDLFEKIYQEELATNQISYLDIKLQPIALQIAINRSDQIYVKNIDRAILYKLREGAGTPIDNSRYFAIASNQRGHGQYTRRPVYREFSITNTIFDLNEL